VSVSETFFQIKVNVSYLQKNYHCVNIQTSPTFILVSECLNYFLGWAKTLTTLPWGPRRCKLINSELYRIKEKNYSAKISALWGKLYPPQCSQLYNCAWAMISPTPWRMFCSYLRNINIIVALYASWGNFGKEILAGGYQWYCNVYGWYASQIRGLLRRLIGFITTSVILAHLITIIYWQYSAIADLDRYNSPLLTH
jgi:hypothetical protein